MNSSSRAGWWARWCCRSTEAGLAQAQRAPLVGPLAARARRPKLYRNAAAGEHDVGLPPSPALRRGHTHAGAPGAGCCAGLSRLRGRADAAAGGQAAGRAGLDRRCPPAPASPRRAWAAWGGAWRRHVDDRRHVRPRDGRWRRQAFRADAACARRTPGQRTLTTRNHPRLAEAEAQVPAGLLVPPLKLQSPKETRGSAPEPGDDKLVDGDEYERTKGRLLPTWGCGDTVRAGQPRVVNLATATPADLVRFSQSHRAARHARGCLPPGVAQCRRRPPAPCPGVCSRARARCRA